MEFEDEEQQEDSYKTEELPAGALFTTKIAPAFNGRTSWFAYEELIEEFLDTTILNGDKIGPALRSRLIGDAAVYKPLFDRDLLKVDDRDRAAEYFKSVLRPNFIKGAQHVFLWRFLSLFKMARAGQEMIKWIGRWTVAVKRLKDAWMDLFQEPEDRTDAVYLAAVGAENASRAAQQLPAVDPNDPAIFRAFIQMSKERHSRNFPMNDNLMTLIFIVMSDLTEDQRERLVTAMEVKQVQLQDYTFSVIRAKYIELYCAPKNSLENPNIRMTGGNRPSGTHGRSFLIVENGILDDEHHGFWVQDEETGEEGFMQDTEDVFWTIDESQAWVSHRVPGRKLRRGGPFGKAKGRKGKGRGFKGRRNFRPYAQRHQGQGKGYMVEEQEDGFNRDEDGTTQQGFYGKGKFGKRRGYHKGKGKGKQQADAFKGKGKSKKGKAPKPEGANVASEGTETYDTSNSYSQNDWSADSWWLEEYDNSWSGWLVAHIDRTMEEHSALVMKSMQNTIDIRYSPSYVVMDLGCTKSMGSRPAIMEFVKAGRKNGLTFEFRPCHTLYAFANSQQSYCSECLVVWFPTEPPCHTTIDILEEGNVPFLLSLPQMKNLYMTIHLTPHCEYLTCQAFGLDYTPCNRSTSHHMILDLCKLKLNPVTTAGTVKQQNNRSQQAWVVGTSSSSKPCPHCGASGRHRCPMDPLNRTADPVTDDEELIEELTREFEKPFLKKPAAAKQPSTEHYDKAIAPTTTKTVRFDLPKDTSTDGTVTADPEPHGSREVPSDVVSGNPSKRLRVKTKTTPTSHVEAPQPESTTTTTPSKQKPQELSLSLRSLHERLENKEELLKLHLKHYHMSARQFKLRTSELKLPEKIHELYQEVVSKCESCQQHKPAPVRSRI